MADNRMVGGEETPLTSEEQTALDAERVAEAAQNVIDADPDVIAEKAIALEFESSKVRKLLFQILFKLVNDVRVLEGKLPLDMAVVRENLRKQLRDLS